MIGIFHIGCAGLVSDRRDQILLILKIDNLSAEVAKLVNVVTLTDFRIYSRSLI